ncbi:MAG: RiPP maturation radical SAM C-methyltransferase [Acidobacteria bacterium]|nr:RiPP maturation radical SAM C-methyltransferase [Acidobacteriota bacterium]
MPESLRQDGTGPRVVLCHMPWATTQRPSIALGILSRLCEEAGVGVRCLYPNLDMSALVGFETAGRFANERALYGLSEHLFSVDVFGREALDSDAYLDAFHRTLKRDEVVGQWCVKFGDLAYLRHLRDETVPHFLDAAARRVLDMEPTVVGFSATFNQVMASLALARRVKIARPAVQILAGGACFDGEMGQEYHRGLPEVIDHVFLGEAEESFREYLRRITAGEPTDGIPGVTSWRDGRLQLVAGRPLANLDESPMPDYDAFYEEAERLRAETGKVFNVEFVPFESSRGCWWGQKNHCVFCGINDDLMSFRAKSIDRVIREIATISARYQTVKLTATDWIISHWHCDELFERLIDLDLDLELFYEVRASMKKAQIVKMKRAGVVHVQPGIESLSTPLLQLMKKGTSAIRHVMFLRWCREIGVHLSYNMLAGFPGEEAQWYRDMAALIPRLRHIQPPLHNVHFIEMHRFAPLFEDREALDVDHYALRSDYTFNFPEGRVDPRKIGYFFEFNSPRMAPPGEYVEELREAIKPWIAAHEAKTPPVYEYVIGAGFLQIRDTRHGDGRFLRLADLHQDVVLLCDEVKGRQTLAHELSGRYPKEVADGTLDAVVNELIESDVLMAEGSQLLTLPIGHRVRTTEELRAYVLGGEPAPEARQPARLPMLNLAAV